MITVASEVMPVAGARICYDTRRHLREKSERATHAHVIASFGARAVSNGIALAGSSADMRSSSEQLPHFLACGRSGVF
jgi:hypothetical protein